MRRQRLYFRLNIAEVETAPNREAGGRKQSCAKQALQSLRLHTEMPCFSGDCSVSGSKATHLAGRDERASLRMLFPEYASL